MSESLIDIPFIEGFEIIKIATVTTTALNLGGTADFVIDTQTDDYAHNLGYAPLVLGYILVEDYYEPLPYISGYSPTTTTAAWYTITISADTENVSIQQRLMTKNLGSSKSATTVKYILLRAKNNI